jgi:hypothetical protein
MDATTKHRDNVSFAEKRDRELKSILPATAGQAVKAGIFKRKTKARERLRSQRERGEVFAAGEVMLDGRWNTLWATTPSIKDAQHEAILTETIIHLRPLESMTRVHVPFDADAKIAKNGESYLLEQDRGSEGRSQVEGRMRKYDGCQSDVIWICSDRKRVEELKGYALSFSTEFWFVTLQEIIANPQNIRVEDARGNESRL